MPRHLPHAGADQLRRQGDELGRDGVPGRHRRQGEERRVLRGGQHRVAPAHQPQRVDLTVDRCPGGDDGGREPVGRPEHVQGGGGHEQFLRGGGRQGQRRIVRVDRRAGYVPHHEAAVGVDEGGIQPGRQGGAGLDQRRWRGRHGRSRRPRRSGAAGRCGDPRRAGPDRPGRRRARAVGPGRPDADGAAPPAMDHGAGRGRAGPAPDEDEAEHGDGRRERDRGHDEDSGAGHRVGFGSAGGDAGITMDGDRRHRRRLRRPRTRETAQR